MRSTAVPSAPSPATRTSSGSPTTATRSPPEEPRGGVPGHAQNWGQIPKAVRTRSRPTCTRGSPATRTRAPSASRAKRFHPAPVAPVRRPGLLRRVPGGITGRFSRPRTRPTVTAIAATQAAISARRVTPSLARMCSTCAPTVRGERCSSLGDLRVRHALGDEPRDLELAGRERPPRLFLHAAAAGAASSSSAPGRASGRLPSASARPRASAGHGTASASRFARRRHAARSSRAQGPPRSARSGVPAARPPPRGMRARRRSSRRSSGPGHRHGRARAGAIGSQSASSGADRSSQRSAASGPARRERRADPVTTNGTSSARSPVASASSSASSHRAKARSGSPADERRLGQAPQRRQDELDLAARAARSPATPRAAPARARPRRARTRRTRARRASPACRAGCRARRARSRRGTASSHRPAAQATWADVAAITWRQYDCSISSA